jgi:hypothetical protein
VGVWAARSADLGALRKHAVGDVVIPANAGPVFQRRLRINREAAAYWIVRSSRTMTTPCEACGRNSGSVLVQFTEPVGAIRGVYHRARIRATRWPLRFPALWALRSTVDPGLDQIPGGFLASRSGFAACSRIPSPGHEIVLGYVLLQHRQVASAIAV